MSDTIDGAYGYNEDADFEDVSDPSFYEEDSEPNQIYLESVLPRTIQHHWFKSEKIPRTNQRGISLITKKSLCIYLQ